MEKMDRTAQLLAFIVHKLGGVDGRVRLIKLAYMIDLEARGWLGRPISSLTYRREPMGPHDKDLEKHLINANEHVDVQMVAMGSYVGYSHRPRGAAPDVEFNGAEIMVIDKVLSEVGDLSRRQLVEDVVYQTPPMKRAIAENVAIGTPLDMEAENNGLRKRFNVDFIQLAASMADKRAGRTRSVREHLAQQA